MNHATTTSVTNYYDLLFGDAKQCFWDKIGFVNIGYWKDPKDSIEHAQINLIETLVDSLANRDDRVLDVACGKGASTKFLTKYFDPKRITGINISERQLNTCRAIAPECDFQQMDAAKLAFDDATFGNILCIEAACHFRTREQFLKEAHRVLKPGGRLAMSDVVLHDEALLPGFGPGMPGDIWPKENYLPHLDAYREMLARIGFSHHRIEDSNALSVHPFREHRIKTLERELGGPSARPDELKVNIDAAKFDRFWTWCMVYAVK